jgi:rubredoxin
VFLLRSGEAAQEVKVNENSGRRETGATVEGEAPENRTPSGPIPMLLWCPSCGKRHIDVGEFATKVHHTHACQHCGMVWRPAVVATCGVQFLPGFKND